MIRRIAGILVIGAALVAAGCHHAKVINPIANVNSKQPDKVLFDRAMEAMKKGKYDVARITLQTMINAYPDSEFVARAKLSVGDSWYAEGTGAALQQAEIEYKDFRTFFPNMAEAAEAQLKIATIHYRQMEKADRDFTHAKRAEEEYRQLILDYPDSKLVEDAKQKLRDVQEVLAEKEYRIGRFYLLRESWAAAIARLKSMTDAYPLYSKADDALMLLGSAYEREIDQLRANRKMNDEQVKGKLIEDFAGSAAEAYARVVARYPAGGRADAAKERLAALHRPVPEVTAEALAANKAEEESRDATGRFGRVMLNLKKHPDMAAAAKVGEPTMNLPPQTNATDIIAKTTLVAVQALAAETQKPGQTPAAASGGTRSMSVEMVPSGATPPAAGAAAPAPLTAPQTPPPAQPDTGIEDLAASPAAKPAATAPAATAPAATAPAATPANTAPAPRQVNDAPKDESQASSASQGKPQDSTSNKKKKNKKKPSQ